MKITLHEDHHTCDDGCCDTYGYYVSVDGNKIGYIEGDDVRWLAELLSRYLTEKQQP
jgi:hypothetical protein